MNKYKTWVKKLIPTRKPGKKGAIIIVASLLLLGLGAAGAFYLLDNKDDQNKSEFSAKNEAATDFDANAQTCTPDKIAELEKINPNPEDGRYGSIVYNRLATCYYDLKQYKKSLQAAEKMKKSCEWIANPTCYRAAEAYIENAKNPTPDLPPVENKATGEKTPEIQREIDKEEGQQ